MRQNQGIAYTKKATGEEEATRRLASATIECRGQVFHQGGGKKKSGLVFYSREKAKLVIETRS